MEPGTEEKKAPQDSVKPAPEQVRYANLLFLFSWLGILLMMITYFIYVAGIMEPHIALEDMPRMWSQGVSEYLASTDSPAGWGWMGMLNRGDYLNFLGIALLAVLTIVCYFTLLGPYARRKDWLFFSICLLEICVLTVAASGILGTGGH